MPRETKSRIEEVRERLVKEKAALKERLNQRIRPPLNLMAYRAVYDTVHGIIGRERMVEKMMQITEPPQPPKQEPTDGIQ